MSAEHGHRPHDAPGTLRAPVSHDWRPELREAGLRVTKQRLAVLEALEATPHQTADNVLDMVRRTLPGITVQSIYTVIHSLVHVGLLRKLELPNSPARYEPELNDNHHHVVCTECGRIDDVSCAVGHAPCMHPEGYHGMKITVAHVVYHGICTECAAQQAEPEVLDPASAVASRSQNNETAPE
ncbi:Fur family transcriptional regulator [Auritidibacter ignavus]|uniref:Fur family transcriptional regulator n=1 Tax=Auritidibacter ignavus TaxID=678932 RepID=UPI00244B6677|nr:Fur family transcriptional regulator [Auritidibacter ignavus]WGH84960.1 Fur family transcriptional regulator [Auritidibacter ignavus]